MRPAPKNMKDVREQMVYEIKHRYGLTNPAILSVMLQVPREEFISEKYKNLAYHDGPVPIGYGQTMSQPYTVAFMTDLLIRTKNKEQRTKGKTSQYVKNWRVLEIGTGSGYQAAVLSKLVKEVYTVEIVSELAKKAKKTLKHLGYKNIHVKSGSGEWGWKEKSPFDAIIITAGIQDKIPETLFEQLKVGGVLVAPMGRGYDKVMMRYKKLKDSKFPKLQEEKFGIFHFVPFVEEAAGPDGPLARREN